MAPFNNLKKMAITLFNSFPEYLKAWLLTRIFKLFHKDIEAADNTVNVTKDCRVKKALNSQNCIFVCMCY